MMRLDKQRLCYGISSPILVMGDVIETGQRDVYIIYIVRSVVCM